jgi:protein disulfide-isomerase A1
MKSSIILFLSLILVCLCVEDEEFPIDSNVTVLTNLTFDKALEKYDNLFVMFYAPWCGHCKNFKPHLERAAGILRKENIICAKVDATEDQQLSERFDIRQFPTIKYFKKGVEIDYNEKRVEEDVIKWVRKKSGPQAKLLKTIEEVESFQKVNNVSLIYFGKNAEDLKIYEVVALKNEEFAFGIVEDETITKKFNAKLNSVVLFKNFDEKRNDLEKVTDKDLNDFLDKYSERKVGTFSDRTLRIVFGQKVPALVYFGEKGDKWDEAEKILNSIADKIIDKLRIVMTELKEQIAATIAEFVGVKIEDLPALRIIDTRTPDIIKYKMEGDIVDKNILSFIEGWEKGTLKIYLKSQEEPEINNLTLYQVVGKTYQKEVIDNDKDVMIVFYAIWCPHCNEFLPTFKELAKKLKEKNPKILFARIDGSKNDVESVKYTGLPAIFFYPGNKKDQEPLKYDGDRTIKDMIKFIKENAYHPIIYEEEKKEEKKKEKKEEKTEEKTEEKKDEKKDDKTADL